MGGHEIRKVAVSLTVMVDYDTFSRYLMEDLKRKFNNGSWSPAIELANVVGGLPGVHEVVAVTNLTMQNTGRDFEVDAGLQDAS